MYTVIQKTGPRNTLSHSIIISQRFHPKVYETFEEVRDCEQLLNPHAKHHVKDISELRECIVTTWDKLNQCIIDTAVGQWSACLHACVKAVGGHFENKL